MADYVVTGNTSLDTIITYIEHDFGLTIPRDAARAIRRAAGKGSLIWFGPKLRTLDASNIRIHRKANGHVVTNVEGSYPELPDT